MAGRFGDHPRRAGILDKTLIQKAMLFSGLMLLGNAVPATAAENLAVDGVLLAQAEITEVHQFNIPPQELDTALTAYADTAGLRVLFVSSEFAGISTGGVSGSHTAEQALRLLLSGTGITWKFNGDGTVSLQRPGARDNSRERGVVELDTVMVSGEKIERSLKNTASSVSVTDGLAIEQGAGLNSADDIMQRTPNVVTSGTDNFAPAVRGLDGTGPAQGADAFFAGTRPRLNVQIDGRPASYNEVAFGDVSLWDVSQVEVYRGAQSTLQGRNAIGGAIIVKTNDPTFQPEHKARLISGSGDYRQGSVMASGPLVDDQLAYRITFDRMDSQSFVDGFQGFPGTSDPGEFMMQTWRGKLLIKPSSNPDFSTLMTVTDARFSGPQTESVSRPYDEHEAAFPSMPVFEPSSTSGILESSWKLNDQLTVENNLSFTKLLVERLSAPGDGIARIDGHETVLEPRLRFSAMDNRLSGLVGVYLFRSKQNETIDLFGGGQFDDEVNTSALFAETTYAMTDKMDLILGARFEREHHERDGFDGPFVIDLDETYQVALPKLGVSWEMDEQWTVGAVASKGYNGGGAGFTYDVPFESYRFEPEYVRTLETFARGSLYGGKLSVNGNLFYSNYTDFQLPFDLNDDPDIWSFIIDNADNVVTYGLELDATLQATAGLQIGGGLGLLKTKIRRYDDQPLEGNELPRAPAYTANLGLRYLSVSGLELSTDTRYISGYYSSVKNLDEEETKSHYIWNAQLGYLFDSGRVFAYVNNIFDVQMPIMIEPGDTSTTADDNATIVRPRTLGAGVEVTF